MAFPICIRQFTVQIYCTIYLIKLSDLLILTVPWQNSILLSPQTGSLPDSLYHASLLFFFRVLSKIDSLQALALLTCSKPIN